MKPIRSLRSSAARFVGYAVLATFVGMVEARSATQAVSFDSVGTWVYNGNFNLGWQFSTSAALRVTSLGYLNPAGDTPVGIFNSAGELLVAATVGLGDSHDGLMYFHTLDVAYLLSPGENYQIVGVNGGAWYTHSYYVSGMTVDGNIEWVGGGVAGVNYDGLLHFGTVNGSNGGYFGPNFTLEPVPEPSAAILLECGLGASLLFRRRRQRGD